MPSNRLLTCTQVLSVWSSARRRLFSNKIDAGETSRASLIFQKIFPDAVSSSEMPCIASISRTRSHIEIATTKQNIDNNKK